MPRGSDKHSPRQDESLQRDTRPLTQGANHEGHIEDYRAQEGETDDEPVSDAILTGDRGRVNDDDLAHDEVETRSLLAASLRPSIWPADREALMACATEQHAPAWLVELLAGLPDGTFSHTEAVWEALGGRVEFRG
jgi:hypothetical protein